MGKFAVIDSVVSADANTLVDLRISLCLTVDQVNTWENPEM